MEYKDAIIKEIEGIKSSIGAIPNYGEDIKELKDAVAKMQLAEQKTGFGGMPTGTPEMKSIVDYMAGREVKTTGTVLVPSSGGYLSVPYFADRVFPKLYNNSPMMSVAEVIQVDGNIAELPIEVSAVDGSWVGEIEQRTASDWKLGMANIPVNEYISVMPVSQVLLEDSNLTSIESYLTNNAARSIGRAVGKAFVSGTGNKQPEGLFTSANLPTFANTGAGYTVDIDDLFTAMGKVPAEALDNAKWLMSSTEFFNLAANYKDEGVVLMPMADGFRPQIFGHEVVFMDAPNEGTSNAIPVVFGDIFNAYKIVMRKSLEMQRDPYSKADYGQVVMRYRTRVGGALVQPDSVIGIKCTHNA